MSTHEGGFHDELFGEAKDVNPEVKTASAACKDPKWKEYVEAGIKAYNTGSTCVSNAQKVQKFAILPMDFSIPGNDLTSTMKLKRSVVVEKNSAVIESLYA